VARFSRSASTESIGVLGVESLEELYDRLAMVLARSSAGLFVAATSCGAGLASLVAASAETACCACRENVDAPAKTARAEIRRKWVEESRGKRSDLACNDPARDISIVCDSLSCVLQQVFSCSD
jgi:hypothetical protein